MGRGEKFITNLHSDRGIPQKKATSLRVLTEKVLEETGLRDKHKNCLKNILLQIVEMTEYPQPAKYTRHSKNCGYSVNLFNQVVDALEGAGYITQSQGIRSVGSYQLRINPEKPLPMNAKGRPYILPSDLTYPNTAPAYKVSVENSKGKKIDKTANLNNDNKGLIGPVGDEVRQYREMLRQHKFTFLDPDTHERITVMPSQHQFQKRIFNSLDLRLGGGLFGGWWLSPMRKEVRATIEINDFPCTQPDLKNAQFRLLFALRNGSDTDIDCYSEFLNKTTKFRADRYRKIIKAIVLSLLANNSLSLASKATVNEITYKDPMPAEDLNWIQENYGSYSGEESWHATISRIQRRFVRMFPDHFPEGEKSINKEVIGVLQRMQSDYAHDVMKNYDGPILGVFDGFVIIGSQANLKQFEQVSSRALAEVIKNHQKYRG